MSILKKGHSQNECQSSECQRDFSGPQGSWSVHVCCLHLKNGVPLMR